MGSFTAQLNVRNDVHDMHESMRDLYAWEKEIKGKEAALARSTEHGGARTALPMRGTATRAVAEAPEALRQPAGTRRGRDCAMPCH